MSRTTPSLITRLRRRLSACAWVFALLVLGKSVLATACQTDGLSVGTSTASERTSLALDIPGASTEMIASAIVDVDDSACFHAGSGDCHCSCSHSTALPMTPWLALAAGPPPARPTTVAIAPRPSPLNPMLRPPIA